MLAGGGTGGHLAPGIAVADELRRRRDDLHVLFLGTGRPVEARMVGRAGHDLRVTDAVRMPRSVLEVPLFPFRLWRSIRRAKTALRELDPVIVVGLGGYGAVPAVRAAHALGIPSVLLEQNSVPGRANRWLSRVAAEVYVQFECSRRYFRFPGRVHVLGNPLRRGIAEGSRERGLETFSLDPDRKTLLVLGGSQGARRINHAVCDALEALGGAGAATLQIVHQTGPTDLEWVSARHATSDVGRHVAAFIDAMPDAYAAADLIVGRAGATTLAEIAAVGRPSVLVPYPHAADNHQVLNAKVFEDAGAAVIVPDDRLDGPTFARVVTELMTDDDRRRRMAEAARTLAKPNATRDVCDRILSLLQGGRR